MIVHSEYGVKILTFPKKSATSSAKTFGTFVPDDSSSRLLDYPSAQLFAVASAIHGALIEDIPVTKRYSNI